MEQATRNKLRNVVTQCRKLLEESIGQQLEGQFGIRAGTKGTVQIEDEARMAHLSEEDQQYRRDLLDHLEHIKARGFKPKDALDQLIREIAFTHLNRLCAYKMMEARQVYVGGQKFREAVSRGINSNGFKFYLADHADDERLFNTGQQELAYRHFLDWLGGLLSEEIGVLFNPNDPANRLYPRQTTLDKLIALLNGDDIKQDESQLKSEWSTIWEKDETIGWVYQYFTPKELRDKARRESQSPRNSYELAFRNQFFTPRYVVEFLTDNTLGRIWYDMMKGDTQLKGQCRYMVRRHNEVFTGNEQAAPKESIDADHPRRSKKDPREITILDPACGSGHFLLYCFDLLLTIYEEAYNDPDIGQILQEEYASIDDLRRDIPRLIVAHNLFGIDIDLRCTQIAALALWLRCQRAFQEMGLGKTRPVITRSNIVCAEPMPGERQMLTEFISHLQPTLLGQLVEGVFEKMEEAAEVGSLLTIEDELREAIVIARKQWVAETKRATDSTGQPLLFTEAEMERLSTKTQRELQFDIEGITDDEFFEQAESKVIDALRQYSEAESNGHRLQRALFAEDSMQGFGFIDVCNRRYDVILMNPPFGEAIPSSKEYLFSRYATSKYDLATTFADRARSLLKKDGLIGELANRVIFFGKMAEQWRRLTFLEKGHLETFVDLGLGVLDDAMVEAVAFTFGSQVYDGPSFFMKCLVQRNSLESHIAKYEDGTLDSDTHLVHVSELNQIPDFPFAYWMPTEWVTPFREMNRLKDIGLLVKQGMASSDNFRFVRLWWEVPPDAHRWWPYAKGGGFGPQWHDMDTVVNWEDSGAEIKEYSASIYGTSAKQITNTHLFGRRGITYPASRVEFSPRALPEGCVMGNSGPIICFENRPENEDDRLLALLALLCSSSFRALLNLTTTAGDTMNKAYREQAVVSMPIPPLESVDESTKQLLVGLCNTIREIESYDETCHYFFAWGQPPDVAALVHKMRNMRKMIDASVAKLYGFSGPDYSYSESGFDDGVDHLNEKDPGAISYRFGCVFGRWDIRLYEEGGRRAFPDVFDRLPFVPPGKLSSNDSQKVISAADNYPLQVDADGLLVDDSEHNDDVVRRLRDAGEIMWQQSADGYEAAACERLKAKSLRAYLRKSGKGGFWDDHIRRYSKSRRKAPIYWLLQSSKKNYALWIYYHRFDKDMLFKALLNYVEPKIQREENRLAELRSQKSSVGESGKVAKKLDRDIEKQEDLLAELRDFEEKLRKVAEIHLVPDLNDGVVLNIAPLYELVPWKEAKKYWNELLDGKYEWSSIGKQLREKGMVK